MIKVENLVKRYQELLALDHFSLEVKEGEILGLLGPNGSGKTTAINCMLSLLKYDKGSIEIFGKPMLPTSLDSKAKIGLVPQDIAVFEGLSVEENISYFCSLYIRDKKTLKKYVDEAITFVGLDDFRKFRPSKLSGGLQRRLNIACGIAHHPQLIFLDEPTVAVDPQSRNNILEGIVRLNEAGATIVYTSHYMEEVEQLCTRIVIMDNGHVIASGTKESLKEMITLKQKVTITQIQLNEEDLEELRRNEAVIEVRYHKDTLEVHFGQGENQLMDLLSILADRQITYGEIYTALPTLNDVFLELTGKELRDV